MMKRYLIEFGTGLDLHGGDCEEAAVRALKDAVHHCCMAGTLEILGVTDPLTQMKLKIKIAVPKPETVDPDRVLAAVGYSRQNTEIDIVEGGLTEKGVHVQAYGPGDDIMVANAVITVFVDV